MIKRVLIPLLILSAGCWGQGSYTLPLGKANTALSLPSMTAGDGVLYEAHRSFDVLRFSSELRISSYDLSTRKELRNRIVDVPRVHGARAAEGFFLSPDGKTLIYAELYEPTLLLALSVRDLSEIRRTRSLPFTAEDRRRLFAGFDENGFLSFASSRGNKLRFVRVKPSDFTIASEIEGPQQVLDSPIIWSPKDRVVWLESRDATWREHGEDGRFTGNEARYQGKFRAVTSAVALGAGKLIAFFGNMIADGAVVSYHDGHSDELQLMCVPHPYGKRDVAEYLGAICTTNRDIRPGHGGDDVLSSEFLLLNASGPTIVWRHPMDFIRVADSNEPDTGLQTGDPLLVRSGPKLLVVAPSKPSALTVYELDLGDHDSIGKTFE